MRIKISRKLLILILVLIAVAVYLLVVCLPYKKQGGVLPKTREMFQVQDYYSSTTGQDRAAMLPGNQEALEERLRLIANAKERIILSTFDFKSDNSGKLMLGALLDAADRGVEVQVLIDGFSYFIHCRGNDYFRAAASAEHFTFKIYNPINLLRPWELMARLHDKYLIADDKAYIIGGRNTYDFFLGSDTDYINYDWDVLVYNTGEEETSSLKEVLDYFHRIWEQPCCKVVMEQVSPGKKKAVEQRRKELGELYQQVQREHPQWLEEADYLEKTVETNQIRLLSNPIEPKVKEPVLFYQLTELMRQGEGEVYFHTPYILCSEYMFERLEEVCQKQEPVHMMTNSVANNGNPFGAVDYKVHKERILGTGVKVMEYDSGVSYHGKCMTVGNRLSAMGSFNWDMRSAYLDTEIMLVIDSKPLNQWLRQEMEAYEKEALTVIDQDSYDLKEGQTPQKLTGQRKWRVKLLRPFDALFRYLM